MKRISHPSLLAGLFILLAVGASPAVHAQTPPPEITAGPELVIYADSEPSTLHIPAPDFGPRRSAATLQVTFIAAGAADPSGYTCQDISRRGPIRLSVRRIHLGRRVELQRPHPHQRLLDQFGQHGDPWLRRAVSGQQFQPALSQHLLSLRPGRLAGRH